MREIFKVIGYGILLGLLIAVGLIIGVTLYLLALAPLAILMGL